MNSIPYDIYSATYNSSTLVIVTHIPYNVYSATSIIATYIPQPFVDTYTFTSFQTGSGQAAFVVIEVYMISIFRVIKRMFRNLSAR